MGEDRRPPLSRRVPGATNMPKAQVRGSPPVLPDEVLERLRAEVSAARRKPADQPNAQQATQAAVQPQRLTNIDALQRPPNADVSQRPKKAGGRQRPKKTGRRPESADGRRPEDPVGSHQPEVADGPPPKRADWRVMPNSPLSPTADADDNTEPIPAVRLAKTDAPARDDRHELAGLTPGADRADHAAQDDKAADLDDTVRLDVAGGRDRICTDGQTASADMAESESNPPAPAAPVPTRAQPPAPQRKRRPQVLLNRRPKPQPKPGRQPQPQSPSRRRLPKFTSASRPIADGLPPASLQALFAEASTFEEVVASARQGFRPASISWRYRLATIVIGALFFICVVVFLVAR